MNSSYLPLPSSSPLLSYGDKVAAENDDEQYDRRASSLRSSDPRQFTSIAAVISFCFHLITVVIIIALVIERQGRRCSHSDPIWGEVEPLYSPAQNAIKYERRVFNELGRRTEFHGPPSPAVDAAWDSIFSIGLSRLSEEEARMLPNRTEPIPGDESHFIIALNVFHELHCLNYVRRALSPDYYGKPQLGEPVIHGDTTPFDHTDHCVNILRESIMCHADVTPNVFQWDEDKKQSFPHFDSIHTCRNWDSIKEWTKQHRLKAHFDKWIHVGYPDAASAEA